MAPKSVSILFGLLSAAFLITACSGSGGGGSGAGPGGGVGDLAACDGVVTDQKVSEFNSTQGEFLVAAAGANVTCSVEQNVNGKVSKVQVQGYSAVRITPGLQYRALEADPTTHNYKMRLRVQEVTPAQIRAVLTALQLPYNDNDSSNYEIANNRFPSYVRFSKGALFYVNEGRIEQKQTGTEMVFLVRAEYVSQLELLDRQMDKFLKFQQPLELLWYKETHGLPRRVIKAGQAESHWDAVDPLSVIRSVVREDEKPADTQTLRWALAQVSWWGVEAAAAHQALPELLTFAESEWNHPVIADNTVSSLLSSLKYIIQLKPSATLSSTLSTYQRIQGYFGSQAQALQAAVDYVGGKSWTPAQFELLVELSESMKGTFRSWDYAVAIATHEKYNRESSLFMAQIGGELKKRGVFDSSSPSEFLSSVVAKMAAGLKAENKDLYFGVFDSFQKKFSLGAKDAESICDRYVLTGKITAANQGLYVSFIGWLKDTAYLSISEALGTLDSLTVNGALDGAKVTVFKEFYTWLTDTVYLNRTDAVKKAGEYAGKAGATSDTLNRMKAYHRWMVDSVYLNRNDALEKAELAIITNHVQDADIKSIQSLTDWYVNSVYLNRNEAFERSQNLVLVQKVTPEKVVLLKDLVSWLVDSIYLNRSDAAKRGEGYLAEGNGLDSARVAQLKKVTRFYIDEIYLGRGEALDRTENLVITLKQSAGSTDVLMDATKWLISDAYISRGAAADQAQGYLLVKKMTAEKLAILKQEFRTQKNKGTSTDQALKLAEAKAFGG